MENLLATSDGELIENPRLFSASAEKLACAQRLVAGRAKGSNRRRKAVLASGEVNRKIARQRRDHLHKVSRSLVDSYDLIAHEDLDIKNMIKRPAPRPDGSGGYEPNGSKAKSGLNREISSAGWGMFISMLTYKAEGAGRTLVAVEPRYSSQRCNRCGDVSKENRRGERYSCRKCGHQDHADINAARNVLGAGLALHPV